MSSFDIVLNNNSGACFFVIDDLKKAAFPIHRFQSFNEALNKFESLEDFDGLTMPTLGVEKGTSRWELLQRVNGVNVLVQDYKEHNSAETKSMRSVLDSVTAYLVDEHVVDCVYSHAFFDRIGRSCPVYVPLGKGGVDAGLDSSYCADKRLKTISGFGFDSINQLYVNGHGWVNYREIQEDPAAFANNGFLFVEGVNVNYVFKRNLTGIDGQMDITPHDFSNMLQDINKEFSLRVFDIHLGNSYIIDSFDDLKDAVKAWYELPTDLTAQVNQTVGYSYQQIVFNGVDDNFEEISYEKAVQMYGFETDGLTRLIADATSQCEQHNRENFERFARNVEKE